MKHTLLTITCFLFFKMVTAQHFQWVKTEPIRYSLNPSYIDVPLIITSDYHLISVSTDSVLQVFGQFAFGRQKIENRDTTGHLIWSFTLNDKCFVQSMTSDAQGRIFIGGVFLDTLRINGIDTLFNTIGGLNVNSFLISIDLSRQLRWKRNVTLLHSDATSIRTLDVDPLGNCFYAYENFTDSYIIKLSPTGQDIGVTTLTGAKMIGGISFDDNGNLYVTGAAEQGQFTIGTLNYTLTNSYNVFVARYNSSLQPLWAKFARDATFQTPVIKADPAGNAFIAGTLMDSTSFGTVHLDGPQWVYDVFIVKVDSTGNFTWGFEVPDQQPSITGDFQRGVNVFLDCDNRGKPYFGGIVRDTVEWGNSVISGIGSLSFDAFSIVSLDSSGIPQWSLNGGSDDFNQLSAIVLDRDSNLYFTGNMQGNGQFDTVAVTVTGANSNYLIGRVNMNIITGINHHDISEISLYPNPSSGEIYIPQSLNGYELMVYDYSGRLVHKQNKITQQKLNLTEINPGLYLMTFTKGNQRYVYRWVKE